MREILFYKTDSERCPVEDFIDSLSGKQAQKVLWVLRLIEELDSVPSKYLKKLANTNDIWEVRVGFGNDIFRFLGFFDNEQLIILTNGFAKKTMKTPVLKIELAEWRKQDYLSRRQNDE